MIKTDKKLLGLILLLLISKSAFAGITNIVSGAITQLSQDNYTIYDIEERFTKIISEYLGDTTRKPSVTIDDLADELHENNWPCLSKWIIEFSDTLLKTDPNKLTDEKISAIGKKLARKHLGFCSAAQLKAMLHRLKTKFENDPKVKSLDWYEILKHRRHLINNVDDKSGTIDIDVIEMTVDNQGHKTVTETIDHVEFDKDGHEIEHTHKVTTTELAQKQ